MDDAKRKSTDAASHALVKKTKSESTALVATGGPPAGAVVKKFKRSSGLTAPIMQLSGHQGEVFSVKFSPSGQHIASGSFDRTVLLWNVYGDCANYGELKGLSGAPLEVCWSRDGSMVYAACTNRILHVWDAQTGETVKKCQGHGSYVNSCAAARRGLDLVATASDDGSVRVWDPREKRAVQVLEGKYPETAVAWGEDGVSLFSGGIDNTIKVWDVRGQKIAYKLEGHDDTITGLRVSPNGNALLSSAMDNKVCTWDIKPFAASSDRRLKTFEGAPHGFEKNLIRPCWSSDSNYIASGSGDRTVVVWNVHTGRILYKLPGHKGCVNEVDWHSREPIIVSGSNDKTLFLGELNPSDVK